MPTRHDEEGFPRFPNGAAPQFDRPYRNATNDLRIIRERAGGMNPNQSRENSPERNEPPVPPPVVPPPRITRHLLIPREIGVLPSGQRYHFWPPCPHMGRARSFHGSRIYSVCQTCMQGARAVMPVLEVFDFPRGGPPGRLRPQFEPEPDVAIEELVVN